MLPPYSERLSSTSGVRHFACQTLSEPLLWVVFSSPTAWSAFWQLHIWKESVNNNICGISHFWGGCDLLRFQQTIVNLLFFLLGFLIFYTKLGSRLLCLLTTRWRSFSILERKKESIKTLPYWSEADQGGSLPLSLTFAHLKKSKI